MGLGLLPDTHCCPSVSPQMFPLPVANGKGRPASLAGAQFGGSGRSEVSCVARQPGEAGLWEGLLELLGLRTPEHPENP